MGLLLSVLVACVGVVELLAFYSNVRRNFVTVSTQTNLSNISKKYLEDLEQHKRYLENQITITRDDETESSLRVSSENIEIDCLNVITSRSRSPSPRKYLLTETVTNDKSGFPSPRHFEVTNANADVDINLPTYTVKERNDNREGSPQRYFKIQSDVHKNESIFPLPKQFIVTERETSVDETFDKPASRSPSPIPKTSGEQDVFRRSPSPYPPLILPVPRNSICNELVEDTSVSVVEVDEEAISRSPTPEKLQLLLESKHNTTEYWSNKILVVPPNQFRSNSPECKKFQKADSSCKESKLIDAKSTENNNQNEFTLDSIINKDSKVSGNDDNENENEVKEYDEQFLDSLDGVKKKKLSRQQSSRRSRKKKSSPSVSFDDTSKDDSLSSSMQNNDAQIAKTLTDAANVLKNVNREGGSPPNPTADTSKGDDSKTGDPFWDGVE